MNIESFAIGLYMNSYAKTYIYDIGAKIPIDKVIAYPPHIPASISDYETTSSATQKGIAIVAKNGFVYVASECRNLGENFILRLNPNYYLQTNLTIPFTYEGQTSGFMGYLVFHKIDVDSKGNIYSAASYNGGSYAYIVKYSSNGTILWTKQTFQIRLCAIYVDSLDNFYTISTNLGTVIIVKHDESGNVLFTESFDGPPSLLSIGGICVKNNKIYMSFVTYYLVNAETQEYSSDVGFMICDMDGNFISYTCPFANCTTLGYIAVDSDSNIYLSILSSVYNDKKPLYKLSPAGVILSSLSNDNDGLFFNIYDMKINQNDDLILSTISSPSGYFEYSDVNSNFLTRVLDKNYNPIWNGYGGCGVALDEGTMVYSTYNKGMNNNTGVTGGWISAYDYGGLRYKIIG